MEFAEAVKRASAKLQSADRYEQGCVDACMVCM